MSVHGVCFDEGMSGNCGLECKAHESAECSIIEEIIENSDSEEYYDVYIYPEDIIKLEHLLDVDMDKELALFMGYDINYVSKIEEEIMSTNIQALASLMIPNLKTVGIKFEGSTQTYTYKTTLDLEVDDLVLIPKSSKYASQIAAIHSVDDVPNIDINSNTQYKWIISKVDLTSYEGLLELERKLVKNMQTAQQKKAIADATRILTDEYGLNIEETVKGIK